MLTIGLMSDLHVHRDDQATDIERLIERINSGPAPDLLILAGDVSHRTGEIRAFLRSIELPCPKCWVPGNHDIWVIDREGESDSSDHRYRTLFPQLPRDAGWHYLPSGPLYLSRSDVAVVGTIGWFTGNGYSEWFDADAGERDMDLAEGFAQELESQIETIHSGSRLIVVTHHLPHSRIPSYSVSDGTLWSSEAHPFGYPHQHETLDDGYRLLELPF